MSNTVTAISLNVGAGASVSFQPAAKQAWEINLIGSNNAFVANVPDVEVSLTNGVLSAVMLLDPTTDPGNRGRMHKYLVNNTLYLSVKNTGAAGAEISITGKKINANNVLSNIVAIGAGLTVKIDPGPTYDMVIYEMGASNFTAGPADINPDVSVGYDDGTFSLAKIWDPTMVFGHDKQLQIPVSHTLQLAVTDTDGGGGNFAYSAEKARGVVYAYDDVGIAGTLDVAPPDGQEWVMTTIAAETLAGGGAPNDYPDATIAVLVGANESNLMEAGSIATSLLWNAAYAIAIDHTKNLRATNVNAAAQNVCIAGFLTRQYI